MIAVIGGGYFGLYLSWYFSSRNQQVVLFEKEHYLMSHASYNNQARVHNGYHYPRSVLTALRSRVSFPRFVKEFPNCIDNEFQKIYMIGKPLSKVTAYQFRRFCERIGAPISTAPENITKLINPKHIEAAFLTQEFAFDAIKLRNEMLNRLDGTSTVIKCNTLVDSIQSKDDRIVVHYSNLKDNSSETLECDHVFNCTYSLINDINKRAGLPFIPLKHEMTEMCVVEVPPEIQDKGITVMCGPFFSVMPFPSVVKNNKVLHSFSHVRYTPHYEWRDEEDRTYINAHDKLSNDRKHSAWDYMRKDAARYIPCLEECQYVKSLWEVKTVLPSSEIDDSRPILCRFNHGMKGFHCVMGGKIDNVYDAITAIQSELRL